MLVAVVAAAMAGAVPASAGEGVVRVLCQADGKEMGKGRILVGGQVKGDCPRADLFLPDGSQDIVVEHDLGDGSFLRGRQTVTVRDGEAKRLEVTASRAYAEDYYYKRGDFAGLLKNHPNSQYADEAAYRTLSPRAYLDQYPGGKFAAEARKEVERLRTLNAAAGKVFRDCPECPEMVVIPAGSFQMGSPWSQELAKDLTAKNEFPQHMVEIKAPFAIGVFEITQGEWRAIMGENPSKFHGDNRPVENVSLNTVREFIKKLNAKTGKHYRLPSEAEWEYAARAGTTAVYWWGDDVGEGRANCHNCGSQWDHRETAPVGSFSPNRFGLYDTAGNVWELVQDCLHEGYKGAPNDGTPWQENECRYRVGRGGSWADDSWALRSAKRGGFYPDNRDQGGWLGFRIARTLP